MNRRDALKTIGVSCAAFYFPSSLSYPVAKFKKDGVKVVPIRVHWNPHDHWVDDLKGNNFILRSADFSDEEPCYLGFWDLTEEFRKGIFGDDFEKREMTKRIFVKKEDAILCQYKKDEYEGEFDFTVQNFGMQSIYGPVDIVSKKERIENCDAWITEVMRVSGLSKTRKEYF
jgi:hypothetical protein